MKKETPSSDITGARSRIADIQKQAAGQPDHRRGLLPAAFQELHTAMEELQVAEEELRQQNEELLRAHDRLAAERARYQDLFEFAPDAYLVTDLRGTVREANRAATQLLGITTRYLIGKPLSVMVAEEDVRAFRLRLLDAEQRHDTQEWETRLRRRPGGAFHAAVTLGIIPDHHGAPNGLRWLIRDVTERVLADQRARDLNAELTERVSGRTAELEIALDALQASLRQREEQTALLQTLLSVVPMGFAFLDPAGRYVHVNAALARFNGLSVEAHLGRHVTEILPPEHWQMVESPFRRALAGETVEDVEISVGPRTSSDTPRHFSVSFYPVRRGDDILGVGAVVRDFTERKNTKPKPNAANTP